MSAASVLVTAAGLGLIALALIGGKKKRRAPPPPLPPEPPPPPLPPRPPSPGGWTPLTNAELTDGMRAMAIQILRSDAPIGSIVPFTDGGQQYGGFITYHGTKRAVEIWRPA